MTSLDVFQSWWAMEFRRPDRYELSTEERYRKIADAGYAGIQTPMTVVYSCVN